MTQLDAFVLSQNLRQRLVEFSLDRNFVRNPKLTEICRLLWSGAAEGGGLVSDLWVEGAFPSKAADETLADLAAQGEFDGGLQDHLHARGAVPRDRKLYLHQREAIREAQKTYPGGAKPALVITAGTGAGKTECFLLPILNDLFQRRKADRSGVRCVILYPMNALVNDQVDRVHEWLKEQDEITLFHFTSETPEDSRQANKDGVPQRKEETFRMRTRQEARGLESHDGRLIDPGGVRAAQRRISLLPTTPCSNTCFAARRTPFSLAMRCALSCLTRRIFTPGLWRRRLRCCCGVYCSDVDCARKTCCK